GSTWRAAKGPPKGGATASDVQPGLVRMIPKPRKNRTHWANTQENIFCMNALSDFSRIYEPDEPHLTLRAYLDQDKLDEAQVQTYKAPAVDFHRPLQTEDLGRTATLTLSSEGQAHVSFPLPLLF